jgi:hypothetical protein
MMSQWSVDAPVLDAGWSSQLTPIEERHELLSTNQRRIALMWIAIWDRAQYVVLAIVLYVDVCLLLLW